MKELYMQQMDEQIAGMSDAEYQHMLDSAARDTYTDTDGDGEPATQEDKESEHDAWWNSLTDEQKQQLYNDQEEAFKLTIEEINYERK